MYVGGNLAEARAGYQEYSGDPIALCRVRAHTEGVPYWGRCRIGGGVALGEVSHWGRCRIGGCCIGGVDLGGRGRGRRGNR